ncbi:hypothetical protein C8Q74DRAFT_1252337 [Fomes fomentarius]|nr:hypothetical protein C8Q74DRAFT_1252337 [Fomes fomentarius]
MFPIRANLHNVYKQGIVRTKFCSASPIASVPRRSFHCSLRRDEGARGPRGQLTLPFQVVSLENGTTSGSPDQTESFLDSPTAAPETKEAATNSRLPTFRHILRSLNPESLHAINHIDVSGKICSLRALNGAGLPPRTYISYTNYPPTPFPPGTCGFFYLATSHAFPEASELRFRITGPSPELFPYGRDLLTHAGLVWHIPLLMMVKSPSNFAQLLHTAAEDRLISSSTKATCEELLQNNMAIRVAHPLLHSHFQPFVYDFGTNTPKIFWLLTKHSLRWTIIRNWFARHRNRDVELPIAGSVVLCLEPRPRVGGVEGYLPGVSIRCMKILTPLEYAHRPAEQELSDDSSTSEDPNTSKSVGTSDRHHGREAAASESSGSSVLQIRERAVLSISGMGAIVKLGPELEGWPVGFVAGEVRKARTGDVTEESPS